MRMNLFVKLIILSMVFFTLSYIGFQYSKEQFKQSGSQLFHFISNHNYQTFHETVSFMGTNKLVIDTENNEIDIQNSKNNDGKVLLTTGSNQNKEFQSLTVNHELNIKVNNLAPYNKSALTIYVPNQIKIIDVKTRNGDIIINHVNLDQLTATNVNGDIDLSNLTVNSATVKTVNGDIHMQDNININELEAKTVNGDIKLSITHPFAQYQLNTITGDILVTTAQLTNPSLQLNPTYTPTNNRNIIRTHTVTGSLSVENK